MVKCNCGDNLDGMWDWGQMLVLRDCPEFVGMSGHPNWMQCERLSEHQSLPCIQSFLQPCNITQCGHCFLLHLLDFALLLNVRKRCVRRTVWNSVSILASMRLNIFEVFVHTMRLLFTEQWGLKSFLFKL